MEHLLRTALLSWLGEAPSLIDQINSFTEEEPISASAPYLTLAATASTDWSTKDRSGREIRLAVQLQTRGNDAVADGALVRLIEKRITALPKAHDGFSVINARFLRARSAQQRRSQRTILLEYTFRLLENLPE